MDRVVYILGAGFSAPLGLPVISNFVVKSKDMYYADPAEYSHFKKVYDVVAEMAVAKNYFDTDLFNIEEVFSIIEMDLQLQGKRLQKTFVDYISDVIEHYTPSLSPYGNFPGNWQNFIFGKEEVWRRYGAFVASVLNAGFYEVKSGATGRSFIRRDLDQSQAHYDIISLNYDCVLEIIANHICRTFTESSRTFWRPTAEFVCPDSSSTLAKLHGSVDDRMIVPPTWRKSVTKAIESQWRAARKLLAAANHIRIVGYSLPVADAYVKYLLKSSLIHAHHLKTIDVITLDHDGATKTRYEDFITFKYFRFRNANVIEYLDNIERYISRPQGAVGPSITFDGLERMHEEFMG